MITTIAGARTYFRERTNERSTTVLPDATIDEYLQIGIEALNRRTRYFYADSSALVTFVAETQEYALSLDVIEVKFVTWRGSELAKSSIEEFRRKNNRWQQETSGSPEFWAHYADKLVFLPKPNAEAVAASATPTIRFISRPADVSVAGFTQLPYQEWPIAIAYAIAEWSATYPDSAVASGRSAYYREIFKEESEAVLAYYSLRGVQK